MSLISRPPHPVHRHSRLMKRSSIRNRSPQFFTGSCSRRSDGFMIAHDVRNVPTTKGSHSPALKCTSVVVSAWNKSYDNDRCRRIFAKRSCAVTAKNQSEHLDRVRSNKIKPISPGHGLGEPLVILLLRPRADIRFCTSESNCPAWNATDRRADTALTAPDAPNRGTHCRQ